MADDKPKVEVIPPTPPFLDMFNQVQPPAVPQLQWGRFFISRWLHNWQLGDLEKAREIESRIAEHQKNQQAYQIEMIIGMTTMMDRYQSEKSEYHARTADAQHEMEMMALEKQSKMLDNQLKLMQFNDEQLDYKLKQKDMRDALGEG